MGQPGRVTQSDSKSQGSSSDSRARGPGFETQSGNILLLFLPLIQEVQLSVTGKRLCTKYLHAQGKKSVVRSTDRPDMTIAVYRKTTAQLL